MLLGWLPCVDYCKMMFLLGIAGALAATGGMVVSSEMAKRMEAQASGRRVALVVGIDEFDDSTVGKLQYTAKDAQDMAEVLGEPSLGDFDVTLRAGRLTANEFWALLKELSSTLERRDVLLVYVATHGTLTLHNGGSLVLLLSDSQLGTAYQTGVVVDELDRFLKSTAPMQTALIVDSCYNGSQRSVIAPAVAAKMASSRGSGGDARIPITSVYHPRLFAADVGQSAFEDHKLENGVYTHFFVNAIWNWNESDLDGDRLLSIWEAHVAAMTETYAFTLSEQRPHAFFGGTNAPKLVLAGDRTNAGSVQRAYIGGFDDRERAVLRLNGIPTPRGPVSPGLYTVELAEDDRVIVDVRVRIRAGDWVSLDTLEMARSPETWVTVGWEAGVASELFPTQQLQSNFWHLGAAMAGKANLTSNIGVSAKLSQHTDPYLDEAFPFGAAHFRAGAIWGRGAPRWGTTLGPSIAVRRPYESNIEVGPGCGLELIAALPFGWFVMTGGASLEAIQTRSGLMLRPTAALAMGSRTIRSSR